jgi:hypothetical protein
MSNLRAPVAPNLPKPTDQYESRYHVAFNNVLRLFFNQLDNAMSSLLRDRGGRWINNVYGAFQNNSDVTLAAANTATLIPINTTDYTNGTSYVSGNGIHVAVSALYNYQFSIQFANTSTAIHSAVVWLRKNGVDVPGTASKFDVPSKHGSSDGYLIGACNFYVDLLDGEYIELWWACDSTSVFLESAPAQTTPYAHPSIPSVVATLSFVSSYQGNP